MNDHPLVYLVRCRVRGSHFRGALLASVTLLAAAWQYPGARLLLVSLAAGVWPAVFTAQALTALGPRGQELESTSMSPRQMVDGLAGWLAWRSLPAVACLALYLQAPLALTLGFVVAYLGILGWVWSDGEDDLVPRALVAALCLAPGLLLLKEGWTGTADLVTLVVLRAGCLAGWRGAERLALAWRGCFRASSGRAPQLGRELEDAILYRELRRTVHRTSLPLLLLVPCCLGVGTLSLAGGLQGEILTFTLSVLLLLVQSLRAGWATVGCLADEREGRTLEAMVGTRLHPLDFVRSWGRWGGWPVMAETLVVGALVWTLVPGVQLASGLLVVLACSAGAAYAGVAASADAPRRLVAQDTLGLWLAAGFWLPGLLLLLAAALGAGLLAPLALVLPWHWRRRALRSLNVQPDVELQLHRLRTKAPAHFKRNLLKRLEAEGVIQRQPESA